MINYNKVSYVHILLVKKTIVILIQSTYVILISLCLKGELIFFTEILYLISEKYWFRHRIACWLILYNIYDKIINFKEENKERS